MSAAVATSGGSRFVAATSRCSNCNGAPGARAVRCRCGNTNYCTRECQRRDWSRHALTCGIPQPAALSSAQPAAPLQESAPSFSRRTNPRAPLSSTNTSRPDVPPAAVSASDPSDSAQTVAVVSKQRPSALDVLKREAGEGLSQPKPPVAPRAFSQASLRAQMSPDFSPQSQEQPFSGSPSINSQLSSLRAELEDVCAQRDLALKRARVAEELVGVLRRKLQHYEDAKPPSPAISSPSASFFGTIRNPSNESINRARFADVSTQCEAMMNLGSDLYQQLQSVQRDNMEKQVLIHRLESDVKSARDELRILREGGATITPRFRRAAIPQSMTDEPMVPIGVQACVDSANSGMQTEIFSLKSEGTMTDALRVFSNTLSVKHPYLPVSPLDSIAASSPNSTVTAEDPWDTYPIPDLAQLMAGVSPSEKEQLTDPAVALFVAAQHRLLQQRLQAPPAVTPPPAPLIVAEHPEEESKKPPPGIPPPAPINVVRALSKLKLAVVRRDWALPADRAMLRLVARITTHKLNEGAETVATLEARPPSTIRVRNTALTSTWLEREYFYDSVVGAASGQGAVYADALDAVEALISGECNAMLCIVCGPGYPGRSATLFNVPFVSADDAGLACRTAASVFSALVQRKLDFKVECRMVNFVGEKVYDLLPEAMPDTPQPPSSPGLQRQGSFKRQISFKADPPVIAGVAQAIIHTVDGADAMARLWEKALALPSTMEGKGHIFCSLTITIEPQGSGPQRVARIGFFELAEFGTGKDAAANKPISSTHSAVQKVLQEWWQGSPRLSLRESKVTMAMGDYLTAKKCRTLVVAAVPETPDFASLFVLQFVEAIKRQIAEKREKVQQVKAANRQKVKEFKRLLDDWD
eukprot:TRINITY_DN4801_c0_g1_i1.p1 TRINITY_DN4801_c0_g1~~TRINITY_DN4801_c0_g1_i1.p1  ORF type:complete len:869 (+),score=111.79 TRINITY_DN4801_c0_g1_i1:2234-4840(+)